MKRFFSYNGESYDTHATSEDAIKACKAAIQSYLDEAPNGWADEVEWIFWGEIKQRAQETNVRQRCTIENCDGECDNKIGATPVSHNNDFDYECDYVLVDLTEQLVGVC